VTPALVDDVDEPVALFNRHSPQVIASRISTDARSRIGSSPR
jgi:hypothetical protein